MRRLGILLAIAAMGLSGAAQAKTEKAIVAGG
jgi:hypothetical protein